MKQSFTCSGQSASGTEVRKHRTGSALSILRGCFLLLFVLCLQLPALAQNITVSGNVSDSEGELIGASVQVKGTSIAAITDIDGNYTIQCPKDATLVFSYVGCDPLEEKVNGRTTIDVVLGSSAQMLNEVVAVGYGTMKKSDLTGAISSVKTAELNAKGASTVLESLQGATPGVSINKSNGRANGGFDVEIRGKSSIESNTKPLYIVDGVQCGDIDFLNPQDIERIDVLKDASSTAIYGSRATAGVIIVTTKGGVHVEKEQKATITYDGYYGINHAARMPNFMEGEEYYRYRFLKFTQPVNNQYSAQPVYGFGATPQLSLGQTLLQQTKSDYTSPFMLKELLERGETYFWPGLVTRDGQQQNHYVAVQGASETANYHFGIGYNKEDGMYRGDGSQTISFKGSVDARINKVIKAGFTVNLAQIDNDYASDDAISQAYRVNPYMRPYDDEGKIITYPGAKGALGTDDHQFTDFLNPLLNLQNETHQKRSYRALGNVYLQLDIIKGLNVKTSFMPSYTNYRDAKFWGYINPETGKTYTNEDPNDDGKVGATTTNSTSLSWVWDNTINFNRTFNDIHTVNFMGLYSMESGYSESYTQSANNVMENTDWWNIGSGLQESFGLGSSYGKGTMISYAFRANYSFMDKYLITATMRWDGCSKFADGHKWGSFPSAALAWRINQENFMKDIRWISNLKLRVSYGVTGNNAGVGRYATIVGIGGPIYYPFGGSYAQGYYPNGIPDKELSWETSHEWNAGIDFGFLNGRISGTIEAYTKKSKDLLYNVDLPYEAGGIKLKTNIGSVRNTGIEFSLSTINIQSSDFEWSTTFNCSTNKNEVLEINGVSDAIYKEKSQTGNLFVGRPFHNIWTYAWDGVVTDKNMTVPDSKVARDHGFTPGQSVRSCDYYYACYGLTEGQPIIRDVDDDGQITTDDKVITNADPKFVGSFTSNMNYRLPKNYGRIDFAFNLYTRLGQKAYSPFLAGDYYDYHDRGRGKVMMDYYIPAGQLVDCNGLRDDGSYIDPVYQTETHYGKYPVVNSGTNDGLGAMGTQYQEARGFCNSSFLKVKYITLGYTFDKSILSHIGCKQARIYFTVTNPFVFTKYEGFDPEWAGSSLKTDGPSVVSYQIGASVKF